MTTTFEEARAWDCDPANCYNCAECHHNIGASDWQGAYPCGQWHCWVVLNTEEGGKEYEIINELGRKIQADRARIR